MRVLLLTCLILLFGCTSHVRVSVPESPHPTVESAIVPVTTVILPDKIPIHKDPQEPDRMKLEDDHMIVMIPFDYVLKYDDPNDPNDSRYNIVDPDHTFFATIDWERTNLGLQEYVAQWVSYLPFIGMKVVQGFFTHVDGELSFAMITDNKEQMYLTIIAEKYDYAYNVTCTTPESKYIPMMMQNCGQIAHTMKLKDPERSLDVKNK